MMLLITSVLAPRSGPLNVCICKNSQNLSNNNMNSAPFGRTSIFISHVDLDFGIHLGELFHQNFDIFENGKSVK